MSNKTNGILRFYSAFVLAVILALIAGCAETSNWENTGQYMDDSAITATVKAKILDDPDLKSLQIGVETRKGVVQLSGFVNSREAALRAGEFARSVRGVSGVRNNLIVKDPDKDQVGYA